MYTLRPSPKLYLPSGAIFEERDEHYYADIAMAESNGYTKLSNN